LTSSKQRLIKVLPLLLIIISSIATRCTSAGFDPYIVLEDVEDRRILTEVFEIYGNQSNVFKDGAFILDGPFKIRGNATLRLVNASLFLGVQLAEFEPFFIEVFDEGRLECVNTTIYGNEKGFSAIGASGQAKIILEKTKMAEPPWTNYPGQVYPRLTLLGNSSLEAEASELAYVSTYHGARCTIMGSTVRYMNPVSAVPAEVSGSTVHHVSVIVTAAKVDVSEDYSGYHDYLDAREVLGGVHLMNCRFRNSTILHPLNYYFRGCTVRVEGVSVDRLWTDGYTNITIRKASVEDIACTERFNLRLEIADSTVGTITILMTNVDVKIMNTSLRALNLNAREGLRADILGCEVGVLMNPAAGAGSITIRDTAILNITATQAGARPLTLENVTLTNIVNGRPRGNVTVKLNGSIRFKEEPTVTCPTGGGSTTVERTYPVVVTGDGSPLHGRELTLKQGDVTVWKGSTDATGAAEFTLNFTYFDGRATDGGYSLHVQGAEPAAIGPSPRPRSASSSLFLPPGVSPSRRSSPQPSSPTSSSC